MKFTKSLILAAAMGTVSVPALGAGQANPGQQVLSLIQRISAHYQVLLARSFVDLTYDSITVSPDGMNLVISGAKVYPELDWDEAGNCVVEIERLSTDGVLSFETLVSRMDISGVTVPAACFDPDMGGMMQSFGYDGLEADAAALEITYDLPSSSAEISLQASVVDAANVSVAATLDYFWFRIPLDGYSDEPEPVAYLGEAEVTIENNGLWERLEPMASATMGDLNAVPQMAQMQLGQMLGDPATGAVSPEAQAFVENLSSELARFLEEKNRLVVTVAPERSILLGPDAFDSPADAIALLKPEVSGVPVGYRRMIAPDQLAAALGGGSLDAESRLKVGEALITGVGAPRALGAGIDLLTPLADQWNGEAAMLIAEALDHQGNTAGAYAMALRALAGGESAAISVADAAELDMSAADVLAAQDAAGNAWPGAGDAEKAIEGLIAEGDVAGMRRMANAAAIGRGMPRQYTAAYFLASLAAAGGDKGASAIRSQLDRRFAGDADWQKAADDAANFALQTWTGGLGATIAGKVK